MLPTISIFSRCPGFFTPFARLSCADQPVDATTALLGTFASTRSCHGVNKSPHGAWAFFTASIHACIIYNQVGETPLSPFP